MSRPPNILSTYRSHSYYHVLALCDRSATAEALATADDIDVWTRKDSTGKFGKWQPMDVHDTSDGSPGHYSIIIHGAEDADLGIDSYKLTSYTAANATAGDKNTSLATEGELIITEPKGVVFFDLLISLMNEMKADASSTCFVIKTFFIGHSYDPDNQEQSYTITDVAPIMFLLTDATASYTESGGVYNLQIVALSNGASRLPQFSKAADGASVHLDKAPASKATVAQALTTLFDVIKQNYRHHYDCVIAVAKQKKIENAEQRFYPVEYVVDVDDKYAESQYILSDAPTQYKTHGGDCSSPPSIKNKTGASIEDAIHRIMGMCPQVKRDMVDGDGSGDNAIKWEYKIQSTVETIMDGANKRTRVKYSVRRFMSPRGFNVQQILKEGSDGNSGSDISGQLRENLIEFDYIFSGKNIDILEFNIQMNYGLAYLQTAATSNSFKDQFEAVASRSRHVSMHSDVSGNTGEILPIPVFFSPQLRGLTTTNTTDPGLSVQAGYNMAKHASLEVAEASMKIVGNPRLYSSVTATSHPSNVGKDPLAVEATKTAAGAPKDTPTLQYANFKYWSQLPALAVVNIYMPAHNDDVALMAGTKNGGGEVSPDYAKKFWYDGYYYVYGIENFFDNGEFTQQLLMIAMPNGSLLEAGKLKSETEKAATNVVDCYSSMIKENPPSESAPPAVAYSPDETKKEVAPTTQRDAESVASSAVGDPSKVRGWSKAPPNVKDAILEVSKRTGVDSTILAQFALIESSYNPSAKAKTSSATGLYQHINGTWMGLVRGGHIAGIPPNTPTETALGMRTDPVYSALGGAAYLQQNAKAIQSTRPGDLYLAHFAGPGGAKRVIKACESGRGGDSLEDVLGVKTATRMKNANPQLRGLNADGMRAWAAKKMAGTIEGGIPTAQSVAVPPPPPGTQQPAKAQTPPSPTPVKGKTAQEVVAGLASTKPSEKADAAKPKNPCGTKEPELPNTDALSEHNTDMTKQPPEAKK